MSISELCIKRPVLTLVISFLLIIFGAISFGKLNLRQFPNIDNTVVTITTVYDGANPQLIEKEITTPLENSLGSIAGIDEMQSSSQLGRSRITLKFKLDIDITETLSDIRDKVSTTSSFLPKESKAPIISKNDSDGNPTLIIGVNDSKRDALEITDYIKRYIKPVIEELSGVGEVYLYGERDYTIKVWLNASKMAARNITVGEVKKALVEQSVDIPSGQIKSDNRYFTVVTHARFENSAQFKKLIINDKNGFTTRLNDIAKIQMTSQTDENYFRINKHPAVGIAIIPQSSANPIEVARRVNKALNKLKPSLPNTMQFQTVLDSAKFIKKSIVEVYKTLFEAVIFVILVVLVFLGNIRAALIPIVTVPICLLATFWPMKWLGFSINTITLLALVLAIGLVVDDAIVMLENIVRHRQLGKSRLQASIDGSREILFAIIAMTLTLAAVYAPMGFVEGFTGKLFLQFGFTLSLAVIFSGIVAVTLSPMMCSKMLTSKENRYSLFVERQFDRLIYYYQKSLRFCLNHKSVIISILIVCCYSGFEVYRLIPKELAPVEDQGTIYGIINSPTNSSVDYTDYYAKQLESIYDGVDEKITYLTSIKPTGIFSLISLKDWDDRTFSQAKISQKLGKAMQHLIGVNAFPVSPMSLGRRGGGDNSALSIVILSNSSYDVLNDVMDDLVERLKQSPYLTNVDNKLALNSEQLSVNIKRNLAADLQVNLSELAQTIATMLGGSNPVNFTYDGQNYPVMLQLARKDRNDIAVLDKLHVKSARGKNIPLSSLVTVKTEIGADNLPHLNRLRSAYITAELAPGAHMAQVIDNVSSLLNQQLPDNMQYKFRGSAQDYLESTGSSLIAFLLALVFIYLVMAAQFESFIDPLIILFSVPLALIGAATCLWLSHGSMNIYTNIGMVTLIGLIAKHGILITEFANQKKEQGMDKIEALIQSASMRLRPILMTTAAMVLGALPLAMASGAGAEARQQLGLTIASGMAIGTLFSLYIVPIAYSILSKKTIDKQDELST